MPVLDTAAAKPDLSILENQPPLDAVDPDSTGDVLKRAQGLIDKSETAAKQEEKREADPRAQAVYPFKFEWEDGNGKVWRGDFENTRLTIRQRQLMGVMQTQMSGGVPYNALDPLTQEINLMVSHMEISLDGKTRPHWAKDLLGMDSYDLLGALYEEVAWHEAIFHGHRKAKASGEESGK